MKMQCDFRLSGCISYEDAGKDFNYTCLRESSTKMEKGMDGVTLIC